MQEGRCVPGPHVDGACLEHSVSCFTLAQHADVSGKTTHNNITLSQKILSVVVVDSNDRVCGDTTKKKQLDSRGEDKDGTYWPQEIAEPMTVLAFDAPANHRAAHRSLNHSHNNGQPSQLPPCHVAHTTGSNSVHWMA